MPTPTDNSAAPQGAPQPGARGYEKSDLVVGWVFGLILLLFVSGMAIQFIIGAKMRSLEKAPPPTDRWSGPKRSARAPSAAPREFPRLQISPPADLEAFRAREEAELNTYGWVNRTAGVVHIPITRAMDLLLEKGLPVRSGTNGNKTGKSSLELQEQRPLQAQPGEELRR